MLHLQSEVVSHCGYAYTERIESGASLTQWQESKLSGWTSVKVNVTTLGEEAVAKAKVEAEAQLQAEVVKQATVIENAAAEVYQMA